MEKYSSLTVVDDENRRKSFLQRKVRLTTSACLLLFVVFATSTIVAAIVSHCWLNDVRCKSKRIEIEPVSRSKRDLPVEEKKQQRLLPCSNIECCTNLDAAKPWAKNRLPNTINPVDYQLSLTLDTLNDPEDEYDGQITIVAEVVEPTRDIILHGSMFRYPTIAIYPHGTENRTEYPIDCFFPFPATDTLVIHMKQNLLPNVRYDIYIEFSRPLNSQATGVFELEFNRDRYGVEQSKMILTHFEAVHAREAYPCFDEPGFKTKFQLTVRHKNDTKVLSNWDERETFPEGGSFVTEFETTPDIPTALTAFTIFYARDFASRSTRITYPWGARQIKISLWARQFYFDNDGGVYINATLEMISKILDAYLHLFQEITNPIVPNDLQFLAVPEYPSDAISHWGLIIFKERLLLHNPATTSQLEQQRIALLIAKEIGQQWFGNLVSFRWWNDLWLQEGITNYLKYEATHTAYPQWNIRDQFITEELVPIMMDDSMSTSHPIVKSVNSPQEINELFDHVESSAATAVLRMADYFTERTTLTKFVTIKILVAFLRDHLYGFLTPDEIIRRFQIGPWSGFNFFDRWLLQANYPSVTAKIYRNTSTNRYEFHLEQKRFLNSRRVEFDLYPTETAPFGYVWYIPITCSFGNNSNGILRNRTFYLDRKTMNYDLGTESYKYFHCNNDFIGYYVMDYTGENWMELSELILNEMVPLSPFDYANLLNDAFLDAHSSDESYSIITELVQRFTRNDYRELLPWQTLAYHVHRILDVLEYEPLFRTVQRFFQILIRKTYESYGDSLWSNSGNTNELVLRQTLVEFACRVETKDCINRATNLWYQAFDSLQSGNANHTVPNHARRLVYRVHFRTSYNDSEWLTIESDFDTLVDVQEREHLLEALTQSRQTWHLYQLLYVEGVPNRDRGVDLLELLTLLARNPLGRELAWFYYRHNWDQLREEYGRSNPRLGQLLIDITSTFEDEFHKEELMEFIVSKPGADDNVDARFWSLERANTNYWWVLDNIEDITNAFGSEE